MRIENNLIAGNTINGISLYSELSVGVEPTAPLHLEIVNNTITKNLKGLIAPVDGIFVHNNIITGNDEDVYRLADAADANVLNNLFGVSPDFVGKSGNISGDPAFVAPDQGDYRLQSSSPARAAGTSQLAPTVDIEGHPRDATHPDLGAFESP